MALIGVKDARYGQRLKAFVVKKRGAAVSEDVLKAYVKSNLAGYKVPREIEFVKELPRNSTGKVIKRELVAREEASAAKPRAAARTSAKPKPAATKPRVAPARKPSAGRTAPKTRRAGGSSR